MTETVEKAFIYPPTPPGGLCKHQKINKSPLGDLGVKTKEKVTFSTTPKF
jgi:hypothetical protein